MSADPLNSSLCLRRTTDVLRERGWSKAIPYVLLATKHETFAKNVASHLTGFDFALKAVSLDEARLTHCFHDYSPDVAFLDAHAQAADGSALYETVFSQLKT